MIQRKRLILLFCVAAVFSCFSGMAQMDKTREKSRKIYIGNFLFKWKEHSYQSTMTLMSPHWTDQQRREFIDCARKHGMNRIHIYGVNDENYSGAKRNRSRKFWAKVPYQPVIAGFTGESDPRVKMPDSWHKQTARESLAKWRYWFIECRKAGLNITLWLWCNQADESFNNPRVWPDKRIIDYNRKMIKQLADYEWQGEPLVDEICLKLEADDEWGEKNKQRYTVSLNRLNRLARAHRKLITRQSFWWHNESTAPRIWNMIDWSVFDGIRIQVGNDFRNPKTFIKKTEEFVKQIPEGKQFYISEYYYPDSFNSRLGDAIMEISGKWGNRFRGLDNGATANRWLKKK